VNKKQQIEQEIELAKMMVKDIDNVFRKYAKAAMTAAAERKEVIRKKKYRECENKGELQELYGWGGLTEEAYYAGLDFFDDLELSKNRLSLIEQHRKNLQEIRDRWKGTVNELREELEELSK